MIAMFRKLMLIFMILLSAGAFAKDDAQLSKTWDELVSKKGCLISSSSIKFSTEGSVFRNKEWQEFLDDSKTNQEKFSFLLSKFTSKKPTMIHPCGFKNANEGEMAVYTVQQITQLDWDEYDGENDILKTAAQGDGVPKSYYLKAVFEDENATKTLQNFFMARWEKIRAE